MERTIYVVSTTLSGVHDDIFIFTTSEDMHSFMNEWAERRGYASHEAFLECAAYEDDDISWDSFKVHFADEEAV